MVRGLTPVDLLAMNGSDFSVLGASSRRFGELLADVMRQRLSGNAASPASPHSKTYPSASAYSGTTLGTKFNWEYEQPACLSKLTYAADTINFVAVSALAGAEGSADGQSRL